MVDLFTVCAYKNICLLILQKTKIISVINIMESVLETVVPILTKAQ